MRRPLAVPFRRKRSAVLACVRADFFASDEAMNDCWREVPEMEDAGVHRAWVGIHPRTAEPAPFLLRFPSADVTDFAALGAPLGKTHDHSARRNMAASHNGLLIGWTRSRRRSHHRTYTGNTVIRTAAGRHPASDPDLAAPRALREDATPHASRQHPARWPPARKRSALPSNR